MKIINLLPEHELKEIKLDIMSSQVFRFWFWILISLGFLFVLAVAANLLLSQRITSNNNEIEARKQILSSSSTKQVEQQVLELNKQIKLIETLRSDHYSWSKALIEMAYMVDSETRITSMTMERITGKVVVSGRAADRESMLAFWSTVKQSKLFKDINFPLTNLEKDQQADFTFSFYVNASELKKP